MPKTLSHRDLGGAGTPQEVRDLRQSNFDLHEELGFPVIHKHRWNEQDLRRGIARRCPLHDELYDNPAWDNVCFGTGYVGGYADGIIVYVTLSDTPTDVIRPTPEGLLSFDNHPQMTAPWLPEMGDGDLLILADFDPLTWEILDLNERYVLDQVTPNTIRGPGFTTRSTIPARHRISQEARVDKIPYGDRLYDVPITFDYANVPPDVTPPGEPVPPEGKTYTEFEVGIRIRGAEEGTLQTQVERGIRVTGGADPRSTTANIHVRGQGKTTIFF